ncbi:MAG: AI-2E family transporter [Planctomycetota bacterium]|jgi:AI-2 transport protein TqsA
MDRRDYEQRIQIVCLLILTVVAIGMALYFLRPVLIPFVLALFFVYALSPAIDLQARRLKIRRWLAAVNTIVLGCVLLFLLWLLIWSSVSQMAANAAAYEKQMMLLIQDAADKLPLERFGIRTEEVPKFLEAPSDQSEGLAPSLKMPSDQSEELPPFLEVPSEMTRGLLTAVVSSIMSVLSNGLLVVIFMIFMLAGKGGQTPPEGSLREQIDQRIKRYLLTKVLVSGTTGIFVGLTLWLLGVELAMVFGLLAFLLNFIPNIGSVIATLLPLPVVVLSPDLSMVAKILAFVIPGTIQFAVGNLLEPKIMGQSLDLHPVVVLLGLIFFGWLWGIIGMIIATPIVAITKITLERIDVTAPAARLLAGKLDAPPPDS